MNWNNLTDPNTEQFLNNHLPERFINLNPTDQFEGKPFNLQNWETRLIPVDMDYLIEHEIEESSPQNIIQCFRDDMYLAGLALTVSWGTMQRQNNRIYNCDLGIIRSILRGVRIFLADNNFVGAWVYIQHHFMWSPVITSKVLHFMARAFRPEDNEIPVPIDNAVMRTNVWNALVANIQPNQRPNNWNNCLEGYLRYMTFILYLRNNHYPEWSTTQIENALFDIFQNG